MSDLEQPTLLKGPPPRSLLPAPDRDTPESPPSEPPRRDGSGRRLLGLGALVQVALVRGVRFGNDACAGRGCDRSSVIFGTVVDDDDLVDHVEP